MSYTPKPLDTAEVKLDDGLIKLMELLAQHNHDVWARQRLAEGWRYGIRRDDERKEHPCLAPYEDLPESEKEYDRRMAEQILKAVIALGYRITKS